MFYLPLDRDQARRLFISLLSICPRTTQWRDSASKREIVCIFEVILLTVAASTEFAERL